ncbi:MAG TPA: VWA domain-containing protein, partial [Pyrinomonadaceae bacterium]|nr:VWA domain-containing protein [Pyrinomonadaceae bacterium]
FVLEGKFPADRSKPKAQISKANPEEPVESDEEIANEPNSANGDQPKKKKGKKEKKQKPSDRRIALDFTTRRGVIILNVPPSEVPPDLRERDLTEAAKAVIRSGDSILIDAIRKVSPRRFGDYAKLLPPHRSEPNLVPSGTKRATLNANAETIRRVNVNVVDRAGRAVNGLTAADFTVFESGAERGILSVETTTAPFNLVLLLDVSGSVEERVDFIRKAARNFINTVSPQDKLAVIVFRDDIEVLSNFTTDRRKLSESLDTFDAGGATALYDSLAYTLVETLKPLRGERTAIVILSDGDDNRSFIPFDPLLGAIEESGALIYPLYIPSGLIPASRTIESNRTIDPIRTRYLSLTTKAEEEAKRLAEVSGGVYFPIRRLEDLQKAYDDVVAQLRTAYTVTYRSNLPEEITNERRLSPRLRVSVKREGAYVRIGAAASVPQLKSEIKESFEPLNRESITAAFQKIAFEPQFSQSATDITGEVKAIRYKPFATQNLRELSPENFDINRAPPSFVISDGNRKLAVSRWISPKRTRSYPYERVYNTLVFPKRAAVIPVLKDEGKDGERDFLQWDTFSLM